MGLVKTEWGLTDYSWSSRDRNRNRESFPTNPAVSCVGKLSSQRRCWPSSLGKVHAGARGSEHSFGICVECCRGTGPCSEMGPVGQGGGVMLTVHPRLPPALYLS